MRKLLSIISCMALCLFAVQSCEDPEPAKPEVVPVQGVTVSVSSSEMKVDDVGKLTVTVTPSNATDPGVSYKSSDPTVVEVDTQGNIWAHKPGTVTITVTTRDGGKVATVTITVKEDGPSTVAVTGVTLDETLLELTVGQSKSLTATVQPSNASNKSVSWRSSDSSVASVDPNGKVTAVKAGTANITVITVDQEKTATCKVNVSAAAVAVTGVSLNKASLELEQGSSETLIVRIKPDNATNKNVTWKSSNTSVATVDSNGKVTAVNAGTADITVTSEDGGKTATCKVTVKAATVNIPVTGVSLNYPLILDVLGESHQLIATVSPDNATNKNVTWKSSDTSVATVSSTGLVTLKSQGTATITVTTVDGGHTATCRVEAMVAATGVSLDKTSLTLKEGEQYTLKATVQPSNPNFQGVSWKSSNNSVATVDSNGKVTAVGVGAATITVTTDYGSFAAICNVTVSAGNVAVTGVTLNAHDIGVGIGTVIKTIYETVSPSNATNKNVTWSSDDPSIVSVQTISGEATPTITANKVGTTYIRVRTVDGGFTDACKIQVFPNPVTGVTLSKSVLEMNLGAAVSIDYTVQPSNATNKKVTAKSDNTSIATVRVVGSSTLEVTGVGAGSTYVRVKTVDGGYTASCKVTVIDPSIHVTSVSLDASAIGMWDTQFYQLHATVSPSNATNKNVTWSSSNTNIVTVSSSGLVRGVTGASGTAYVTVKTVDGGKTAQCRFSITRQIRVSGVSLSNVYKVQKGMALLITPTITPSNASDKTGTWTNSNPSAVSTELDGENGIIVRGLVVGGYSQLTFTSNDGKFKVSTTVNVIE